MTINISIKAKVNNLTLSDIYELLANYSLGAENNGEIHEFKGYAFRIETEVGMSINYLITEVN